MVQVKETSRPTRDAYGDEILALGREDKRIFVVDCDIGKERLRRGRRAGRLRQDSICHYLCCFRKYAHVRADPPGGLLPQAECENCLFPRRAYPRQRRGQPPGY